MTITTFEKIINIFKKSFLNFKFYLDDELMVEIWYNELSYMDDDKGILATKKVIATCDFVTIKNIKQAYAEIDTPIHVDNEEGWGLVEQAIRMYGYMRADEAIASLPSQVQKAVRYMGGFQSICEAEKKDVIRGQFNKAMSAVNHRTQANATLGKTLLGQITMYQKIEEQMERRLLQDANDIVATKMLETERNIGPSEKNIESNKNQISHIRYIISQCVSRDEAGLEVAQ